MLQKLNERIQGVVAWLVVILIGITFTLFGVDYYMQAHHVAAAKVTVNDSPITEQAFEANYRRARGMQDLAHMTAQDEKRLQEQVLNQMIANTVMIQAANKNGFQVSNAQANSAILSIPQFQEDGHFSSEKYQQALSAAFYTQLGFQNEVKQGMLLNQQRFAFIGSSVALPDEIERFVNLYMQTRDYDYLIIPAVRFEKEMKVSQQEIIDYYKKNQKNFKAPEQVSLNYVVLSLSQIKDKIKLMNEEIRRYYDENQNNYLTPAQWQVAHIQLAYPKDASPEAINQIKDKAENAYQMLKKNPEQFEKLVNSLSDDKLSLSNRGELPWITAGQTAYDKVLSQLTEPGQISAPEKTKNGFEIFKLLAYRPAQIKPFEQVKNDIKEQILTDRAQGQYTQALEQISDLSYQTPDSLYPIAEALHLKIEKTSLFPRTGGTDNLTKNPQIINAAFSHDVLDLGNNSEPLQIDNDSVVVIRLASHQVEKELPLEAVRADITQRLTKEKARAQAKTIGSQLLSISPAKQSDLIKLYQLSWKAMKNSSRENDQVDPIVNAKAFRLLKAGHSDGLINSAGDYVVIRLQQINPGQLGKLDKEQRESLIQQVEASYGMMDYDLYMKHLMSEAKILRN